MGGNFKKFCLKMKKDLRDKATKLRARRTKTGKYGGVVWKSSAKKLRK